jgi:hypothetical protein
MAPFQPNPQTVVAIAAFCVVYLAVLLRRTLDGRLDLYDFLSLSAVAVVPSAFVFFPRFAETVGTLVGVEFSFVAMFGALFVVLFMSIHKLTINVHELEVQNRALIQELALLEERVPSVR